MSDGSPMPYFFALTAPICYIGTDWQSRSGGRKYVEQIDPGSVSDNISTLAVCALRTCPGKDLFINVVVRTANSAWAVGAN